MVCLDVAAFRLERPHTCGAVLEEAHRLARKLPSPGAAADDLAKARLRFLWPTALPRTGNTSIPRRIPRTWLPFLVDSLEHTHGKDIWCQSNSEVLAALCGALEHSDNLAKLEALTTEKIQESPHLTHAYCQNFDPELAAEGFDGVCRGLVETWLCHDAPWQQDWPKLARQATVRQAAYQLRRTLGNAQVLQLAEGAQVDKNSAEDIDRLRKALCVRKFSREAGLIIGLQGTQPDFMPDKETAWREPMNGYLVEDRPWQSGQSLDVGVGCSFAHALGTSLLDACHAGRQVCMSFSADESKHAVGVKLDVDSDGQATVKIFEPNYGEFEFKQRAGQPDSITSAIDAWGVQWRRHHNYDRVYVSAERRRAAPQAPKRHRSHGAGG